MYHLKGIQMDTRFAKLLCMVCEALRSGTCEHALLGDDFRLAIVDPGQQIEGSLAR